MSRNIDKVVFGIDPGKQGGIARLILFDNGDISSFISRMPEDNMTLKNIFQTDLISIWQYVKHKKAYYFLENVHAMPGTRLFCPHCNRDTGRTISQGVVSTFTFGEEFGRIKAILDLIEADYELVEPRVWQKEYIDGKYKNKQERKKALKEIAQSRYSGLKVTLSVADALLIAEYGLNKINSVLDL